VKTARRPRVTKPHLTRRDGMWRFAPGESAPGVNPMIPWSRNMAAVGFVGRRNRTR
jgi:hypothetical protein